MTATSARRGSALAAARPVVAAAWCSVVAAVALAVSHPLALGALLAAGAAVLVRVGAVARLRRVLLLAVPMLVVLVVVQVLLDRHGLTVLARLGTLPVLGAVDLTLEALVAAGTLALRLLVVLVATTIAAATVDVDALLLAAHRRWPAGALTAALAVRIAPVLVRDGERMADARRCRPAGTPGAYDDPTARLLVVRAVTGSVLERASDLSATLELRGHGLPRARAARRGWTRSARRHGSGAGPGGTRRSRRPEVTDGAPRTLRPEVTHRAPRSGRPEETHGAPRTLRPDAAVGAKRPRSRHDLALAGSAAGLVLVTVAGTLDGSLRLGTDPTLSGPAAGPAVVASALLAALVVAPLWSRRGIGT